MYGFKNKTDFKELDEKITRPVIPILLVFFVVLSGTVGYRILWADIPGMSFADAFYMTVITISTVGFGEVHELTGVGKAFTIFISLTGIGSLFYVLSVLMENLVIFQLFDYRGKKKMVKEIENLSDHIILVGFGRVGQLAANELKISQADFVVIDIDNQEDYTLYEHEHLLKITGDATTDHVLLEAGIERAKGIIVATGDSRTNVFVVLSARVLNPTFHIVSRADDHEDVVKLKRAGADDIVNPYSIGGQKLAGLMINPNITDFLETNLGEGEFNLKIETIRLPDTSDWIGKSLMDLNFRQHVGVSVLALIRDDMPILNPAGHDKIFTGDKLVVLGTRKQLSNLETLAFG
ncbi:MAG: potassium channel protein [Chlorobi bacterium]|nr:potassium channel protein [Chlorobiota bacterium]